MSSARGSKSQHDWMRIWNNSNKSSPVKGAQIAGNANTNSFLTLATQSLGLSVLDAQAITDDIAGKNRKQPS